MEDFRTARRAELVAVCTLFLVLVWGACLIPLPAGRDHVAGANDSLLYNSILGRFMGNTVRMRPRDPEGRAYGIGGQHIMEQREERIDESITDVRDVADRWLAAEAAAARPFDEAPVPVGGDGGSNGATARIRIRTRVGPGNGGGEQGGDRREEAPWRREEAPRQPATLQVRNQAAQQPPPARGFAASRAEQGTAEIRAPGVAAGNAPPTDTGAGGDGGGFGFLVENPGILNQAGDMALEEEQEEDKDVHDLKGKAARYVAETLQAKSKAATLGENLVDAEAARVAGSDGSRVASEQALAKAMQAALAGRSSFRRRKLVCHVTDGVL